MRGYFSSIAKQSGLRYAGQSAHVRALSGSKRVDGLTPLEREETVLVTPSMPGNEVQADIRADRADKPRNMPKQGPIVNAEQKQKPPAQEQISAQIPEQRGTKIVSNEIKPAYSPDNNSEKFPSVMEKEKVQQSSASGRISVVEPAVLKKSVQPEGENRQTLHRDPIQPAELEEVKPSGLPSAQEEEKKEYFFRTAAIIEKGEKGEADIQTILFQEVQEWAAASRVGAGMVHADAENTEDVITRVAQPTEPGVVTIRDSARPGKTEHIRPMEQNFELSIGTISVIIEEPEGPRDAEPPIRQNNKAAVQENGFGFSRLNRSYL